MEQLYIARQGVVLDHDKEIMLRLVTWLQAHV